jgi:hypothetical protein
LGILFRAGIFVVRERDVWPDEDIILNPYSVPKLYPAFDCYPVPDDDIVLDEAMAANVAVFANSCTGENYTILPDLGGVRDRCLTI